MENKNQTDLKKFKPKINLNHKINIISNIQNGAQKQDYPFQLK